MVRISLCWNIFIHLWIYCWLRRKLRRLFLKGDCKIIIKDFSSLQMLKNKILLKFKKKIMFWQLGLHETNNTKVQSKCFPFLFLFLSCIFLLIPFVFCLDFYVRIFFQFSFFRFIVSSSINPSWLKWLQNVCESWLNKMRLHFFHFFFFAIFFSFTFFAVKVAFWRSFFVLTSSSLQPRI